MDQELDDLVAFVEPLLRMLGVLEFVSRQLHPPSLTLVLAAVQDPSPALRSVRHRLAAWPDALGPVRQALESAADEALLAWEGVAVAAATAEDPAPLWRALRHLPLAQEALWLVAPALPPVSRYFLDAPGRLDRNLQARLAEPAAGSGVVHVANDYAERGGYSLYLPEARNSGSPAPLIMALHGGSGHGRGFLWTWLPAARAAGAVLVAPTSVRSTWSLHGADEDTPRLQRILDEVSAHWALDPECLLLTGMSDGGTFAYLSGLQSGSPFTHLAPVAATFHSVLAAMADPQRLRGRPIYITHGRLDWMFPVQIAREARASLEAAGARVTYNELADLSHTYPREVNSTLLGWLESEPAAAPT
jgi:phospholipase/carboxylesterase